MADQSLAEVTAQTDTRAEFGKPVKEPDALVAVLNGYFQEADLARKGGPSGRDVKWDENINLYWNRYDFSAKADWQAKEVMPEVPSFVDRFAAAAKEALVSVPDGFYTIVDPADQEQDLAKGVKKLTDMWLSQTGRNQAGTCLPFSAVFEEQVKLGAIMACSSVTTWKEDMKYGRVAIETVDPRFVWLDPTYRNLYRIRRVELDRHDLEGMVKLADAKGTPIFDPENMGALVQSLTDDQANRSALSGHGQFLTSVRKPITFDEYYCTILDEDGNVKYDKGLTVVANGRYIVRGPEANPFWHDHDWLTYAPLVTTPLSVYGRSYMEDFGSLAKTFTELTNMILDAVHVSALKVYAVVPSMLINPDQLADGLTPGKMFQLEEGLGDPKAFAAALDLGTLSPDAVQVWQSMKNELREAAGINEIGLGQFAPKGRTSATEVSTTQESSSAMVRSIAQTIETRWLDPTLDLVWKTGIQHMKPNDARAQSAVGPDLYNALYSKRKELVQRNLSFQARGISTLIQKSRTLKSLLSVLQILASNEALLQAFLQEADMAKLVKLLFDLSDIDLSKVTMSERDKMIRQITQPLQQAGMGQGGTTGTPAPGNQGTQVAQMLGIGRGPPSG